jgi:branched-subunit amino acid aminotransferase/4-amino-4-deoxychorismate lyase
MTRQEAPSVALRETCRVVAAGPSAVRSPAAISDSPGLVLTGSVPLWPLHRERLAEGGCGETLLEEVEAAALEAVSAWPGPASSRLRLTIGIGTEGSVSAEMDRRLSSLDAVHGPVTATVRVDGAPPLPPGAAKPADRSTWDEAARRARQLGAHQAILVDADGLVIDGSSATVWAVFGDELRTPPAPPAVAGVARRFILLEAPALGLKVRVQPLASAGLDEADELMLSNAFGGVVAVRGRGGPVTARLAGELTRAWSRVVQSDPDRGT